jgi:hypothetical protein
LIISPILNFVKILPEPIIPPGGMIGGCEGVLGIGVGLLIVGGIGDVPIGVFPIGLPGMFSLDGVPLNEGVTG